MSRNFLSALVLLILVACLASAAGQQETEATETARPNVTGIDRYFPIEGKKYEIHWLSGASAPVAEDAPVIQKWNEVFGVDIQIINIENNKYQELMNLRFAAGEIPDIMKIRPLTNLIKWKRQGLLAEIPPEAIQKVTPRLYDRLLEVSPNYFDFGKVDGQVYGLRQVRPPNNFRSVAVWRRDWLENVGIAKLPETLEEAEEAFYAFATGDPDGNGKNDTYGLSQDGMYPVFGAYGIHPGGQRGQEPSGFWVERNGRLVHSAVQPEMKLALERLVRYYRDGVLDPEFITGENTGGYWGVTHAFIKGRIGFTNRGTWYHWKPAQFDGDYQGLNYTELSKVHGEDTETEIIGYGGPLSVSGYDSGLPQGNYLTNAHGFGVQLEDEPDKMGKILTMIEAIATDLDNYITAQFGIRGVSYEMDGDRPYRLNEYKDIVNLAKIGAQGTWMVYTFDEHWWRSNAYGEDEWADKYGFRTGGLQDELKVPIESMSRYVAELNKLRDEMIVQIITGDKPLSYFDEFVEQWHKMGGETITEDVNNWYKSLN